VGGDGATRTRQSGENEWRQSGGSVEKRVEKSVEKKWKSGEEVEEWRRSGRVEKKWKSEKRVERKSGSGPTCGEDAVRCWRCGCGSEVRCAHSVLGRCAGTERDGESDELA
jgi:hypothetical protein